MDEGLSKVKVEFTYLPVINFAMQQNGISVIRQLLIENLTDDTLKNIKVTLTTEPDFSIATSVVIEAIPAKEAIRNESLKPILSTNYFTSLTERSSGCFMLDISTGSESIFRQTCPVDLLAYDQWTGTGVLPEMLAAFITPNHPVIIPIIKRAASILEQWTGSPSLDEYQSRNPDRVRKQMAAIYTSISEQNIIYSTMPAGFEEYGQRIRLADSVMAQKLGTCLDMALLYTSCLKAVGIHPLIVMTNGHAFAGAWLISETFPDNIIDDVSFLTKRTADGINDITLVETTCMNMSNNTDFDHAVKLADGKLAQSSDFVFALDVKRTRYSGIRPVPQRILNGQHWEIKEEESLISDQPQIVPKSVNPYDLSGISSEIIVTKQLLWERKLLDLSLRNNLLNIRITKNTLQLIPADLSTIEDALAEGDEFRILHKPADWENPLRDSGIYQSVLESDPITELVKSELAQKRLHSYLSENDLDNALTYLYRSSRTSMEENGANTLYLALGLLKWYETPSSERPRYAPILLLPVEILRKSAAKGFVIRSREEDAMMNITLLEMLRQNFGITISGLAPLPTDESGVNVKLIYTIIRSSIKNQQKWNVEEQAILGIFSFNKFIMWNDIHNNSHKLTKNKIVSSLMNGKIEWEVNTEMADAADLDKQLSPAEIVLPISADSSQLEAIYEAMRDRTFILHGPPGTGKSQTITNIIANALYRGKRVLFVAEKMAALSVVQNRLAAIGLAPFCLELHSNKTKKTTILSQLKQTSEVAKYISPDNFKQEAERLLGLRKELNIYVEALHKTYPFGTSLYHAITRYQSLNVEPEFDIPQSYLEGSDKETVRDWEDAVEMLIRTANACGHPYHHPLTGITIFEYSSGIKEEAARNLDKTIGLLSNIRSKLNVFSSLLGDPEPSYHKKDIGIISRIVGKLLHIPELTPALLSSPRITELFDEYRVIAVHGKRRDRIKASIETDFTSPILAIDAGTILIAWNKACNSWFLPRYFGQGKIKKLLKAYALGTVEEKDVKNILNQIIDYHKEKGYVNEYADKLSLLFGRYGRSENEDWMIIEQIIDETEIINSHIINYATDISVVSRVKEALVKHLSDGISSFKSLHESELMEMNKFLFDLSSMEKCLSNTLGISVESLYDDSINWIGVSLAKLKLWQANIDKLKDWYQWLLVCRKFDELNISFITDKYRTKNIPTDRVLDTFHKSFNKAVIGYIISKESSLELFKGKIFNDIIEKYRQLTANFEKITKQELYARLASNMPSFTREATQNSEVGILQKNIRNNARGISIRKLFDQIPILLPRMCPCMLMSPISVAQYIDIEAEAFDLIVFDEASQVPTYEAVGAIARGKSIVIVGDPKQMPPTDFFSANCVDEDNIEMEDLESILDDCLALSIPSKYLLWHYRSKHESLIAFSNSEYYNNKLLTFPSPDNIESKVRMVTVNGFYDKGKSRQNRAEAQAVVDEIARRLRDENLRSKSVGVVTFSSVQQSLIEDLLSDLFLFNPDLEALALECEEPLFIKNLENVQGDERDIILFSVGYGPDSSGRVTMNFGPLNRDGGERRLNVAISRARYEMIIYSTLTPEQIDLNKTSSIGVAGLKRFLEYAGKGKRNVTRSQSTMSSEISIENIIAGRLRKLGHTVHTNVGCSGYKIDIGIVDKKNPSKYALGILCDGENYKCTKTARDREIVQNNVLKMLDWNICRIWTMDWWENPDEVIMSLQEIINRAGQNQQSKIIAEDAYDTEQANEAPHQEDTEPVFNIQEDTVSNKQEYKIGILYQVSDSSERLFFRNERLLRSQIKTVIEAEAPISKTLICKRVLEAWRFPRLTQSSEEFLGELIEQLCYYKIDHEGIIFFWKDKEQCDSYGIYRSKSGRDAVDLPPEELANGIKEILTNDIGIPVPNLSRACAQLFGFNRSGSIIDAAMQKGIKEAVKREYIKIDNGRAMIY